MNVRGVDSGTHVPTKQEQVRSAGTAKSLDTYANIAVDALGMPEGEDQGNVGRYVDENGLRTEGLNPIWRMNMDHFKGLGSISVVWSPNKRIIPLTELLSIKKSKDESFDRFKTIMTGTGMKEDELKKLFNDLWRLAVRGALTVDDWNKVIEAHAEKNPACKILKMNGESFRVIMSGQRGEHFTDNAKVEGIAEFNQAMFNFEGNVYMRGQQSTDDDRTAEAKKNNSEIVRSLCAATNFNVIYVKDWERAALDMLAAIAKEKGLSFTNWLDKQGLHEKIKGGVDFGKRLADIAENTNNWNEFLLKLLKYTEDSNGRGLANKGMDGPDYVLSLSKRMGTIAEVLQAGPDKPAWKALIDEMRMINEKPHFDFDAFKKSAKNLAEKAGN